MEELDAKERLENLNGIIQAFNARVSNAYVDLVKDLLEYGKDPNNVKLYETVGYSYIIVPEITALFSTEEAIKTILSRIYSK